MVGATKKLWGKLPLRMRVYYAFDAGMLRSFLSIIGSGVAMSGAVLPASGLSGSMAFGWVAIHKLSSTLNLVLLIVKLALHRVWIVKVCDHFFIRKRKQALVEYQRMVCAVNNQEKGGFYRQTGRGLRAY